MRFNRQSVAALVLPAGKPYVIHWDEALPGFGVRINPTGKVWVVQYRVSGKSRRETIGKIGIVSLDEARETARKTLARVQLGGDPKAEKAEIKARKAVTLGAVADRYLTHSRGRLKPRSYEEVERHLVKHWSLLREAPISAIRRAEVAERLEEIAHASGPIASNRARAALSALFSYAMGIGLAEANPVVGTIKVGEEITRDHVLTDKESAAIWHACRETDHGRIVRLLLLTAQRRDEVADMSWSEIDVNRAIWTIPRERTKNGLAHEVPLSEAAMDIVRGTPRQERRDLIFGEGRGGFSGWSKSKKRLDDRIATMGVPVRPWRLHDLRRTAATRMGDLAVQPHVVEAVLNHVSGHKAGVAGVYNRATYGAEKRAALTIWADHVRALVNQGQDSGTAEG